MQKHRLYDYLSDIEYTKLEINAEIVELAQKIIGKRGMIMEALVISHDFTIEDIHKIRK